MDDKETPKPPTYRDEIALTRHLFRVLEGRLAGRDFERRVNVHPLDWCYLGVLGPRRPDPAALELDEQQPEVAGADAVTPGPQPSGVGMAKELPRGPASAEGGPHVG